MTKLEEKLQARQLRSQGWSIKRIAKHIGVAKSSVSVWCRDIKLTEAQKEALYERDEVKEAQMKGAQANKRIGRERRLQYQQQGREKAREGDLLHSWGCMLYWAEGSKSKHTLGFVNSDAEMMKLYVRFIRETPGIQDNEIRLRVNCYLHNNLTEDDVIKYWLRVLQLNAENLGQIMTKTPISSKNRGRKLLYGTCEIRVHSVQIVQQVYGAIQEYGTFSRPEWLD